MVVVESVALDMKAIAGARIIVIDVPEQVVAQRMRDRGDSEEQIQVRLDADRPRRHSMLVIADAVVVNNDLDEAIADTQRLIAHIQASEPHCICAPDAICHGNNCPQSNNYDGPLAS